MALEQTERKEAFKQSDSVPEYVMEQLNTLPDCVSVDEIVSKSQTYGTYGENE
jgi:hypothetical protein